MGAIFDGTGYGLDGSVWGGELLVGDLEDFRRVGAAAARSAARRRARDQGTVADGVRLAVGAARARTAAAPEIPLALRGRVDERAWRQVAELSRSGVQSPPTTSMGRLFDAVAALCGLRARVNYEGQAAIELEAACDPAERGSYPLSLHRDGELIVIDPREAIRAVERRRGGGAALGVIATRFHAGLADATVEALAQAASSRGASSSCSRAACSKPPPAAGGDGRPAMAPACARSCPSALPLGDGGISYGQAAVAARRLAAASAR